MKAKRKIVTGDFETDPFEHGQMVYPFVAGFYDGHTYKPFWSDKCADEFVEYINAIKTPLTIYFHNGGRFDFFFLIQHMAKEMRIVNGRIIECKIGIHLLRDSFAIMPFALAVYNKTKIDYDRFKRGTREKHKTEIISYLRDDCTDLYNLCTTFVEEFGDKLTIGSAAMEQIKKFHTFTNVTSDFDAMFRKDFYFGGRNQVFKSGVINGPIKIYDLNSSYPCSMRDYLHPVSGVAFTNDCIDTRTCFVSVEGHNMGAFPTREKNGSLNFSVPYGVFHTTIHEFNAALETGTFKPDRVIKTYGFAKRECFDEFVNHFYDSRMRFKREGDLIRVLLYKFVLNSGYGKFAQNPENYADWYITEQGEYPKQWHECEKSCEETCRKKWSPAFMCGNYIIWERPLAELNWFNIATGASITGASRSLLLKGLSHATDPYYCDTDSIICSDLSGVKISETDLGAWKLEASGDRMAIAGKKMYALFDGDTCIKKAHKGANLTGDQILSIANGAVVDYLSPVPTFKWDGSHSFTKRRIRNTAKV